MDAESFDKFLSQFRWGSSEYPKRELIHNFFAPRGKSKGEVMVHRVLKDMGYKYMEDYFCEFSVEELGKLRFDFFLTKIKLFIEFDGNQHYEGSRFHRTRNEWLEAIRRDEMKNEFCKARGYSLLRIPHIYAKDYPMFRDLVSGFIQRVCFSPEPIVEVDLYFQWKAGSLNRSCRKSMKT